MICDEIEALVIKHNLTAPRLTPDDIKAKIQSTTYTILPSKKVMVCELVLTNGFSVRGESAVVSKANFIQEIGEKISYENAVNQIWPLEGYLLQESLYQKILELEGK